MLLVVVSCGFPGEDFLVCIELLEGKGNLGMNP